MGAIAATGLAFSTTSFPNHPFYLLTNPRFTHHEPLAGQVRTLQYSWDTFVSQKRGTWDGVRNYQARNNLMAMREGDLAFFYHSNEGKEIVGIARVVREHYPDPTTDDPRWVVVDLEPVAPLPQPVTLEADEGR